MGQIRRYHLKALTFRTVAPTRNIVMQRQTAVTAHFSSKQLGPTAVCICLTDY